MPVKLKPLLKLIRLDKPIGMLLLLWPTLWALWLANKGEPDGKVTGIFILGVFLMRSAGCIINDIADRQVDGAVARTVSRPLVTGEITVKAAIMLFLFLSVTAFGLVLFLNHFTIYLAILGLGWAVLYPFLKRITHLPQVGLGIAFSWGIPMAFAAELETIPIAAWILFACAVLWPIIYDTQYAMVDRADDIKVGIKSTAILFNKYDKAIIGLLQMMFLLGLSVVGQLFQLAFSFYIALGMVAILFLYQQALIRQRRPEQCFQAFLNNNWVGLTIFLGIVMSYVW